MSLGLLAAFTISMFAFGGALVLLRQLQDSRFWFLVATTAFVAAGIIVHHATQLLTLPGAAPISASDFREEFPGLIMSVMALMAVFYMERLIQERKGLERERAELERELSQAQKVESLGTLAGGIAHEINSPVQFVRDNTWFLQTAFSDLSLVLQKHKELLEAATAGGVLADAVAEANAAAEAADMNYLVEEIPVAIEQSLEGLEQIAEIVRGIKEFSYPNAKEKKPIDINRAIANTITVSRNQWKYAAELETNFDAALPLVPCLVGEFSQVILNLIVNAAHAIEDTGNESEGRITITTRKLEDWAEIEIGDTGTGIPKENCDKVFEPFFTTKEPGRGTGQGLAISHSIITKRLGGTLRFNSEVGKGTVFIIRLPLAGSDQTDAAA
ncbi:MAG: sensor histidine kinase [Kiloniellaceae bacterium]